MIALALKLGVVLAGAVPIGAVLLLGIGKLTGAEWSALRRLAAPMPWVALLCLLFALPGGALPDHLSIWQASPFVGLRGVVAGAALAFAGARLARAASTTFAGVTLALYAWCVTPIAADWLMAGEPGHSVSAIGMMLAVQQIGAGCAAALLLGIGGERMRGDLARLLVAAALGLCYLTYMDYLIIWFGNLPSRVPFYLAHGSGAAALAVSAAMLLGLAAPVALLSLRPGEAGRRPAGASALAGLALFDGWWMGVGPLGLLLALAVPALLFGIARHREAAHG